MEKKIVMIKSAEELEEMKNNRPAIDASLISHRKAISFLIDALTDEKKAIDEIILDSVNHEKVKTALFYTIISDYFEFDKEKFIAENGATKYEEYKTKPVHREQVRTK